VRAVVAAGPVSHPMIRSALFSVLTDIDTPSSLDVQQIADQRRAISAFAVGLAPSATESTPEVVQHEVGVSLGIVGHNGWGLRLTRPSLDRAILCEVDPEGISSQSRVRFRSGRLWRPERHGACLLPWSLLFYFWPANGARHLVGISVGIGSHQR
jgi:hypothetical protein